MTTRIEKDPLGEKPVPAEALYGIQTVRAAENFPISGLRPLPAFVDAVLWIKRSAALTHQETGRLEGRLADAIVQAADEILGGRYRDQFIVDVYQAGAGTSHNMNCNEVLANRANEILGGTRGAYQPVHPNDHVNMAQSTNDVIPTAMRLATLASLPATLAAMDALAAAFLAKGREFDHVIKSGRTHLQDATPIRLGQEFTAYGHTVARHRQKLAQAADWLRAMGIGGTAVGTGLNAEAAYPALMVKHLRAVSGLELHEGEDRIQLMQSMGDIATFSGAFRAWVLDLNKIANDLRLLASGPRTGLAEILLPAVQPGSSIMPGKVNPSIAEMVNQVCYQALGLDTTVALAAEAGQLELNVMMPVMTHNMVFALTIVGNATRVLAERCVAGIGADEKLCAYWLERSPALVTALAPKIGYAESAKLAKEAIATGLTVKELVVKKGLLAGAELEEVLDLRAMTEIGVPGGVGLPGGG
ncbi:MAG: aspartate ammonia-lyase [Gemmatimonadetes bacterium]|nr:aspartate ammonia-lyase [Gemmatimonadota bacterium]MBK7785430.1 aspartate ammonia-lyase [Gemmatimonadota bacterium]MBK9069204.1 aspartate ammonia-lyase [Gemmatimonadota bacterium]